MAKKINLNSIMRDAAAQIMKADRILIVSHVNPDGDTIGSLLALGLGLLSIDKRVVMVSPDAIPARYSFLPGSELVLDHMRGKADLAIAVDCGSLKQLGKFAKVFKQVKNSYQIDHHDFADSFCKHLIADANAAAVGEIIYDFLKVLDVEITPVIATCILTSIIVDTGSFRFSNIRPRTFRICADLLDRGVDLKYLIEEAYWKKTESTVRMEALSVANMKFERNGKLVWSHVKQSHFKKFNGDLADVDGVADDLRAIEGVKVAVVFREEPKGMCRVSIRSADGINVAKIAQHFGGGGHYNSAGCRITNTKTRMNKLIQMLSHIIL